MNKFVEYHRYCLYCKYRDTKQDEEPCNECLTEPVNEDSHKPVKFKDTRKKGGDRNDSRGRRD